MFVVGNPTLTWQNIVLIIVIWQVILLIASFVYNIVGINAGHHLFKKSVHEGDELKSLDYGLYQLAATVDRVAMKKHLFIRLTTFGDHVLHHLFPSLDHSVLPHLRETLRETCKDFEAELNECSILQAVIGQFKQLSQTEPIMLDYVTTV